MLGTDGLWSLLMWLPFGLYIPPHTDLIFGGLFVYFISFGGRLFKIVK